MVRVPKPTKLPWRAASPGPLGKPYKWEIHLTVRLVVRIQRVLTHLGQFPKDGGCRLRSAMVREEDKQRPTFSLECGRYRCRMALQGHAFGANSYVTLGEKCGGLESSVKWKEPGNIERARHTGPCDVISETNSREDFQRTYREHEKGGPTVTPRRKISARSLHINEASTGQRTT